MKKIIITIDGYSGCGKSTTAKVIASRLNYLYIDSGAMYRSITLYFIKNNVEIIDQEAVEEALAEIEIAFDPSDGLVRLNGDPVEEDIRGSEVSSLVSAVSAIPEVRMKMVNLQRHIAREKGVVMDGRDIGSVVFPEAELKIFMVADPGVRAKRRLQELQDKKIDTTYEEVFQNLQERDRLDTTRKVSPLVKPDDAVVIDNSNITFEQQVNHIMDLVYQTIK